MATLSLVKIKPGTTPILTAVVDEIIQDATVYLAIDMKGRRLVKSNYCNEGDVIVEPIYDESDVQISTQLTVQYSQEETLYFRPGYARVEVGWVFEDNTADKTNIGRIMIPKTLIKGVMRYGKYTS